LNLKKNVSVRKLCSEEGAPTHSKFNEAAAWRSANVIPPNIEVSRRIRAEATSILTQGNRLGNKKAQNTQKKSEAFEDETAPHLL